jgi:hypothetical protein
MQPHQKIDPRPRVRSAQQWSNDPFEDWILDDTTHTYSDWLQQVRVTPLGLMERGEYYLVNYLGIDPWTKLRREVTLGEATA